MKKKYYLLLLSSLTSLAQTQIGLDIDGEVAGDQSGWCVALSSDGSTLAVGAPFNDGNGDNSGHVRVYQNISGSWTQIGTDINGEAAGDQSGRSVALSSDGNILAIGAPYNGGNGSNSGHVRIYQNISGSWTQIGTDINGEAAGNLSGWSVALSSNGNILAIGAPFNNGNGSISGHVRVYQNISGVWTQIGADINGEAANDQSGNSIDLSSDGSIVAISAFLNDGNGLNSGHVRVYKNISGAWTQIGADINGEAANDQSGYRVELSSVGNRVAISSFQNSGNGNYSGHVRVYQNTSGAWTQIGTDINGEAASDHSGYSIALSSDGSKVAIGARYNDGNGSNSGHVRIYQDISGIWTQMGTDINGEAAEDQSGSSVALSSDGSIVAIGSAYNDSNGNESGNVRVYGAPFLSSDSFLKPNFSIYPNPSKGSINITLDNDLLLEEINIYNQLGQIVKTTSTNTISTVDLSKGIYNIEVLTSNGKVTKKMIVE